MRAFVINLASRPERLAHIRETFGKAGIPFQRFDAIGPDKAIAHPLTKLLGPRRSDRPWHTFELGCLLSHYELWSQIAAGDDGYGAIFEDDILVSGQLASILEGDFPRDADVVKLETVSKVIYVDREAVPRRAGDGCFRKLKSLHEGTGAYIISRRAAGKLVRAAPSFDEPIDWALFSPKLASQQGLNVYQAIPAVVIQGILVDEVKESSVMLSDRASNASWAAAVPSEQQNLATRMLNRLLNQMRGIRTTIPYVG